MLVFHAGVKLKKNPEVIKMQTAARWMDGAILRPFQQYCSHIMSDNVRMCALESRLRLRRFRLARGSNSGQRCKFNWAKSYSKNRFPLKLAVSKPVLGGGRVGTWEVLQQYISVLEMNRLKLSFFCFYFSN